MSKERISLIEKYQALIPNYESLVREVRFALEQRIDSIGLNVASVQGRVKTSDSLANKVERKEYKDPLAEIHDLAGVRVVCQFTPDAEVVDGLIHELFEVHEKTKKSDSLGFEKMGYQGTHYIVSLGPKHQGARYDKLAALKSEIQVRTILEDAWAQISHTLDYKSEASVPKKERRELYRVSTLLEVSQDIFDRTRETRKKYSEDVRKKRLGSLEFLAQPIDRETITAYTRWKYPNLQVKDNLQELLIRDLDHSRFSSLKDIEDAVMRAVDAIEAYRAEAPSLFTFGTDYLTKSVGFVDDHFRRTHGFGDQTRQAFNKYSYLVRK